ncbi:MAG: hypothetical protein DRI81_20475 [Chloroflexi bacterium]|nr:MAG: hypothetical protein DRI81_20475 [Chloroflexota bacterium]
MKRQLLSLALVTTLLLALLGTMPTPVRAATSFVVNSNADDAQSHDATTGDGTCLDDSSRCTLRAAIEEANAYGDPDTTITFNSAMTITLDTAEGALPSIWQQLKIDASSVWDTSNDRPGVTLDGSNLLSATGLNLRVDNCEVYGLFITNFGMAIDIYAADYAIIGGKDPGQRNVLSGNSSMGIRIHSGIGNRIRGNWIGLNVSGDTALPNGHGVYISDGANNNTIGGLTPGEGNYISGNTWHGVYIQGDGAHHNHLYGNIIGLPATGSQNVGNGGHGVYIRKQTGDTTGPEYNRIGREAYPANTISANGQYGVYILGAKNNYVEACTITTNISDGVRIDGLTATGNLVTANSIHDNGGKGIGLVNGSQHDIAAPTITSASASGASGAYTCANCTSYYRIDIYSDNSDEGAIWHGYVTATVGSDWVYSGTIVGPYVTATATDDFYVETSEFSAPRRTVYYIYLPLIVRNH